MSLSASKFTVPTGSLMDKNTALQELVMGKKYGQAVTLTLMMEAETIFETQDYKYIVYMVD
jgi:hypothetical protein